MPAPTKNTNNYKAKDLPLRRAPGSGKGTTHVNVNQSHVHQPDPERVGADSATAASTCTTTNKVKKRVTDQSRNGNTQPNVGQEQPSEDAGRAQPGTATAERSGERMST